MKYYKDNDKIIAELEKPIIYKWEDEPINFVCISSSRNIITGTFYSFDTNILTHYTEI